MAKRQNHDWPKLIAEQEQSGQSVHAFCKQRGINPSGFYYAQARSPKRGSLKRADTDGAFLTFTANGQLNGHIRVTLKSGATCEVSAGNVEGLKTILKATGDLA